MFELGGTFGWDESFKGKEEKQEAYIQNLNIPTHKNKSCFQFVDVFETLALIYVVNSEINKYKSKQLQEDEAEKLREKIQINLQNVEESKDFALSKTVAKKKQ